jgi:hypothetical protein
VLGADFLRLAFITFWFCDKLHAPQKVRATFTRQRRKQDALQLRYTRDEPKQRIFSGRCQRCLSRTAIVTIATPYDEAVILPATDHFA